MKNATKKAWLMSVLSLVLCVAMLAGSTFAWFTDTASTGVNTIQAGNLKIQLTDEDGKALTDALKFQNVNGETDIFWEPGSTFRTQNFVVKNTGNLAVKYTIALNGVVGSAKLLEVITFSVVDGEGNTVDLDTFEGHLAAGTASGTYCLQGTMSATAGNEYMNETLDGISVIVYATQDAVESDSNGNGYDAGAKNPVRVTTAEELAAALTAGENVRLEKNLTLTSAVKITGDLTIYGNGHATLSGTPLTVAGAANVTIKNVNFTMPTNARNNASNIYANGNFTGKLVLDGCNFSGTQWDGVQVTSVLEGAEVVINNCTFTQGTSGCAPQRFIHIEAAQNSNTYVKVTLTNNYFGSAKNLKNSMIDLDYIDLAGIDFGGNNVYEDIEESGVYVCGPSLAATIGWEEAYKKLGNLAEGVIIRGIQGVAPSYTGTEDAYAAVKEMLTAACGLVEQPLSEEDFNAFFTDGGKITWEIYGKQKVTDTRMFSFGRAANRFGEGRHITEIAIIGGDDAAALDLSAVNGTFALPYNWWNVEDSANTALICKNVTFDGIRSMPSATYQCVLHPTTYLFEDCTFNGNLYSYQNFDVEMTIRKCVFNAPANTQYAFMSQGKGGTITLDGNTFNGYTRGINLQRATADFVVTNNTIMSTCSEADRGAIQLTDGKSFVVTGNTVDVNAGNAFWFHIAATNADVTYIISDNDIRASYLGYSGVTAFDVNEKITSSGNKFNNTDITRCMKKDATVAEATNLTAIR